MDILGNLRDEKVSNMASNDVKITADEISLFKHSEELKNTELYGNLYEVLSKIEKPKTMAINKLPNLSKLAIAALTYNKQTVKDTIVKEWYAESKTDEDPTKKIRCQLCNTPNRYLYYIRNRYNNTVLHVGSSCINKFPGIENFVEVKNQQKQKQRNQKIVARRNQFYQKFGNVEKYISDAQKYFDTFPILMPYELYTKLEDTINRMRGIYNTYVDYNKSFIQSDKTPIELFQLAIEQFQKLFAQAEEFKKAKMISKTTCLRNDIDWLLSENKTETLRFIAQNNGEYSLNTLRDVYSDQIIKKFVNDFINCNHSDLLEIYRWDYDNKQVIWKTTELLNFHPPILFQTSYKNFMKNVGARCVFLNEFTYNTSDIIEISSIDLNKSSIESLSYYMSSLVYNSGYAFIFDINNNKIFLYRFIDRAIKTYKCSSLMKNFCNYIFETPQKAHQYLIDLINGTFKSSSWKTVNRQRIEEIYNHVKDLFDVEYLQIGFRGENINKGFLSLPYYKRYKAKNGQISINYDEANIREIPESQIIYTDNKRTHISYMSQIIDTSMMPRYRKEEIVLIQRNRNIRNNQIGLFLVNGNYRIRQYNVLKYDNEGKPIHFQLNPLNSKSSIFDSMKDNISIQGIVVGRLK